MFCAGCNGQLDDTNSLSCHTCKSHYCLVCLNFGAYNKSSELDQAVLSALKCPSCTNVSRRRRGQESPAILSPIAAKPISQTQLTIESISALLDQKLAPNSSLMINFHNIITQEVNSLIASEMNKLFNELKEELTKTTDYVMEEVKDLKKRLDEKGHQIESLHSEQAHLKNELAVCRGRLATLDKMSRDRNIELQGVPEDRAENVVSLFKTLCGNISYPIVDKDIHACRRVAKMDPKSKRPRNIVITLSSPRMRDEILSATHRFNKEHKDKRLNTSHLGITGESHQIYVTEHLSPESKQLFAAVRRFARENNYAYSWVKFGNIYLRKSDISDAILVKSEEFLKSLQ